MNRLNDGLHEAMVAIGHHGAELLRDRRMYPILADKLGISRRTVTALVDRKLITAPYNMLGIQAKLTMKGDEYLARQRGEEGAFLFLSVVSEIERINERIDGLRIDIDRLRIDADSYRARGGQYSGELVRHTLIEIDSLTATRNQLHDGIGLSHLIEQ